MAALNQFPGSAFSAVMLSMRGLVNAQDPSYSADPTGVRDSAPAINAAITAASTMGGGIVWLGAGTFKIKSTINMASAVSLVGAGHHATAIMIDDTGGNIGDGIKLDAIHGCTISSLTIDALSQRAAGKHVHVLGGDTSVQLGTFKMSRAQHTIDIDMNNWFDGIVIEDKSATNGAWGVNVGSLSRFSFYRNGATGRFPVDVNTPHGSAIGIYNPWLIGNATPANGDGGIRIRGSGDTSIFGARTWGNVNGLTIDPQVNGAETVMAVDITSCYFDFASGACFRFNPIAGLTIPIVGMISNTWFASSATTHNIWGSNGTGHRVNFVGGTSLNSAGFGLRGDTGCDATTFGQTAMNFGPPLSNTSGTTSYV